MSNKRLVAVSLNQIFNLTTADHGLVIHRQKIGQCVVVGNVLSINEQSTKTTYTITDYTAPSIEVVQWRANNDDNKITTTSSGIIMEQTYCKIYCQPRKDASNQIFLVAFYIEPLANLNDLTIHLLEVVRDAKDLKKAKIEFLCKGDTGTKSNDVGNSNNNKSNGAFSDIQNIVLDLVRKNQTDIGISYDEICSSVRSVKQETIRQTIIFLSNEGHIYESVDDTHYKSSD